MTVLAGLFGEIGSWIQVILGVWMLIFIHEAGHFLVAKWAKVRVEAFSLGFGPEMFGFTRGPTRYRVAWIPLGGYVKMSGETERPEGGFAPDDYPSKPVWVRSLIIVAGVVMNAVLGFFLFAAALLVGLKVDPVVVGTVSHGRPAWEAGIRSGDRLVAADGRRLVAFADLIYATIDGKPLELTVVREGKTITVPVTPRKDGDSKTPSIGVSPAGGEVLDVPKDGTAEAAGFLTGDRIVAVAGVPAGLADLGDEVFLAAAVPPDGGATVTVRREHGEALVLVPPGKPVRRVGVTALRTTVDLVREGGPAAAAGWRAGDRPVSVGGKAVGGSNAFLRAVLDGSPASVRVARAGGEADLALPAAPAERLALLRDLRFGDAPSPTAVEVLPGGAAEAAGIPSGARILSVGPTKVARYRDVVAAIGSVKEGPVALEWALDGPPRTTQVVPQELRPPAFSALDLGTGDTREVLAAASLGEACSMAASRCVATTSQIVTTVTGIFRGSVDKDNLGGPIMIAQVARRSTDEGFGHFLWLLGMLSINLMFLNVLPIPVLDGGQLVLLGLEAVMRRRPSEGIVVAAQLTGLVVLLSLMVFISFNDVVRLLK